MINIKKPLSGLLAAAMLLSLSACKKEEPVEVTPYEGILSKLRIGMQLSEVKTLQTVGVKMNQEKSTVFWAVDPDVDLMEISDILAAVPLEQDSTGADIPSPYYVDNTKTIITYYFNPPVSKTEPDTMTLSGWSEELYGLFDREFGNTYYKNKCAALIVQYTQAATEETEEIVPTISTTKSGTENIDLKLVTTSKLSGPSFDGVFTMTETYATVGDVSGYFVTGYSFTLTGKAVKDEVAVTAAG